MFVEETDLIDIFESHIANLEKALDHTNWIKEVEKTPESYGAHCHFEGALEATRDLFNQVMTINETKASK